MFWIPTRLNDAAGQACAGMASVPLTDYQHEIALNLDNATTKCNSQM